MDKDALITSLQKTIESQTVMLEKLSQQVETLLRQLYGKKSEKNSRAKKDEKPSDGASDTHSAKPRTPLGNKPKRSRLPDNLDVVDVVHDIPEDEKHCAHCPGQLHQSGKRITEQLDFIPAKLIKRRHICLKYACRCGQGGVKIASMPNQPIEKGMPGAGLLAEVLVSKYQDAMPLYRQMLRFKRLGYSLSDSTLCDWVASCATLLEPIVRVMRQDLLRSKKLHTDDTTVPVLAKGKTKQGRLWVYLADNHAKHSMCLYDYTATRQASGPLNYLKHYAGYLQADAYSGYDKLYESKRVIEIGCMAHARRKFFDVAVAAKGPSHAQDIVNLIGELYDIERHLKHKTVVRRYYYRKKWAKPILKRLKRIINRWLKRALPNTPFYKALQYAHNHWIALNRYLACGELDIDNNKAERAIKPLVIGRKNWLFAGSHEGGKRAAMIYSIIETCKMNHLNPFEYLADVLMRIPNTLQKNIRELLPYHWVKTSVDIPPEA